MSTKMRWLWLTSCVLLCDFSSKQWIINHLYLSESFHVISFIDFTYVRNPGAAFSFLADKGGWQRWFFSLIAVMTTIVILLMMYYSDINDRLSNIAYAIIIGGVLGNLFDRLIYGFVVDFIDFYIGSWHWPIFNVADTAICIGTILIALEVLYHYYRSKTIRNKEKNSSS